MHKATCRSDTPNVLDYKDPRVPCNLATPWTPFEPKRPTAPNLALGFFVLEMRTAPLAILVDTESVRIVLLVLHRRVVAAFASATS